jgi:hypothetical protein
MYKRFKTLDHDGNGVLSIDEWKMVPALAANPLLSRLIDVFDLNKDKEVDFNEFVSGLSIFSSDSPIEKKLRCFLILPHFPDYRCPQFFLMYTMLMETVLFQTENYSMFAI